MIHFRSATFLLMLLIISTLLACNEPSEPLSLSREQNNALLYQIIMAKEAAMSEEVSIQDSIFQIYYRQIAERFNADTSVISQQIDYLMNRDEDFIRSDFDSIMSRITQKEH